MSNIMRSSRQETASLNSFLRRWLAYIFCSLVLTTFVAGWLHGAENMQLLWGDTHLHSTYSSDAFANGNMTATPDTAYRYAKGIPVEHPWHKARVQIDNPLDFLVVSDHAEFLGVIRSLYLNPVISEGLSWQEELYARFVQYLLRYAMDNQSNSGLLASFHPTGRQLFNSVLPKPSENAAAAMKTWDESLQRGRIPLQPTVEVDTWKLITEAADLHNDPGVFSALIGWEYSLIPGGANLHRVVISDIDAPKAQTFMPFGFNDSSYPIDLWKWLEQTSAATGADFIAIPHNSNISKGSMFDVRDVAGADISAEYADIRRFWEPIVEITQIKGDSETHPVLSPDDPFADFETYLYYIQREWTDYKPKRADYIRSALMTGLELDQKIGSNPYKFGVIGSTDAHTALPSAEESNFHGKMATDSIPSRKNLGWSQDARSTFGWGMSAQGLAAVWATENSREAIISAMRRRHVYATTGTRIAVRVFGGMNMKDFGMESADFPNSLKEGVVPMGGEILGSNPGDRFNLLIEAQADPLGAHLDRLQVVKGWVDISGKSYERVFNVAWAGDDRLLTDGSLKQIGNSVDQKTGDTNNTIGAARLTVNWTDPEFDPGILAFYYVRVLEIPTARHSFLDALALDQDVDTRRPQTIQERAYTSPIWYRPSD